MTSIFKNWILFNNMYLVLPGIVLKNVIGLPIYLTIDY